MAEEQCLLVVVSLTITFAAPQGLDRVYMLAGYRELIAHAQLPVAPLRISWSAKLDSGVDVAELCKYLLENLGTIAALYFDSACKESLTAYPS